MELSWCTPHSSSIWNDGIVHGKKPSSFNGVPPIDGNTHYISGMITHYWEAVWSWLIMCKVRYLGGHLYQAQNQAQKGEHVKSWYMMIYVKQWWIAVLSFCGCLCSNLWGTSSYFKVWTSYRFQTHVCGVTCQCCMGTNGKSMYTYFGGMVINPFSQFSTVGRTVLQLGTHDWRCPARHEATPSSLDGWWWKIPLKWMIARGPPILGTPHI